METKIYITKYALTKGILEANAIVSRSWWDKNVKFARVAGYPVDFFIDEEAFLNKGEAIKEAEKMRKKKIESLKKKIRKLEELKFE